jgi:outer membrane receptor for Fe3+-dicitrate
MNKRGLSTLLDLHQELIDQEDGFWIKIEAWEVDVSLASPYGIRYSLTLHNPKGLRILGYDNAHAVKSSSGYNGRKLPYDHKHRNAEDAGIRYEFKDAHQLLSDFFEDVDKALRKAKEK